MKKKFIAALVLGLVLVSGTAEAVSPAAPNAVTAMAKTKKKTKRSRTSARAKKKSSGQSAKEQQDKKLRKMAAKKKTIAGAVIKYDADNRPLPIKGSLIRCFKKTEGLSNDPEVLKDTPSDIKDIKNGEDGCFYIKGLKPGEYRVAVYADGYIPLVYSTVRVGKYSDTVWLQAATLIKD